MKVFLSWSGSTSHQLAVLFRDWLPSVIQAIEPYVSSEDIDKGARWSTDIAKELEESSYGIIFVTSENLEAPWVNFEAGALSKSLEKSNVSPLLFNVKRSEVQGPLLQFQSTVFEKGDIEKLLKSLNGRVDEKERLKPDKLEKSFRVWWPELEKSLKDIKVTKPESETSKAKNQPQNTEILEQLLEIARQQQRILNDPERLLPQGYIEHVLQNSRIDTDAIERYERLHRLIIELESYLMTKCDQHQDLHEAIKIIGAIHDEFHKAGRRKVQRRTARTLDVNAIIEEKINNAVRDK